MGRKVLKHSKYESASVLHSMILCILHKLAFLPTVEVFYEGLRNQKQHLVVNTYTLKILSYNIMLRYIDTNEIRQLC